MITSVDLDGAGEHMYQLVESLFPLCRSITGEGVRQTLAEVGRRIPLECHEVATGTQVLDWTVPDEWSIRDAYVAEPGGARVIDFRESNLHVVGYSEPVRAQMSLDDLRPHLHTLPEHPDWVPYRTSYYERTWGFCLSQRRLDALRDGSYEVVIDSALEPGSLTYGECLLPGERPEEVLLTTHVCHPSLANDNLSGIALLTEAAERLRDRPLRHSIRLLFVPGTIGSIAWLARNEAKLSRIVAGVVVACVGDPAPLRYKRSRLGSALVDRAAAHVLLRADPGSEVVDFVPWGWDERQFNSPGFDLPVGCLSRSREGGYDEYHSSADDLGLVDAGRLEDALRALLGIVEVVDTERRYVNLAPRGEPQLGKRGLYRSLGGGEAQEDSVGMLWLLNQSDGRTSTLEIAERAGISHTRLLELAAKLVDAGLLAEAPDVA